MLSDVAYIGLGSNLGKPTEKIKSALGAIEAHSQMVLNASSSFYASSPMGPQDQPDYVNAVCRIKTSLQPQELLATLQDIENSHGRERIGERWGPRTLDLDILLYNDLILNTQNLTLPHYGMQEREFVLVPLFEIAPDMIMQDGRSLATWVAKCDLEGLYRLDLS
ncbi:2-amino-4-hydroxy-6-hydroxymethyldihydropteridine diphosphokinase [Glaciecola sp. MH2013]|uniref:2-amino-4-hydroxy-6- hydroxymethyldihydropteridine diphosphokinase n=1 Tax=Glaciecola sp. MH2013 TaxID=2785524 RepID=UPI00189F6731|nr:2-amino-4-hydroxy-6-hydroxymethyldihydropteridine diphosphokinase [Glaciecola sp. MH2013]MBF7073827.1 2-amino-4-hydroxy-6-hydroxymethyldihydropteridine diphosphokinase [Glaciecola sp. MH2013]